MEVIEVRVEVRLIDMAVTIADVVNEVLNFDSVEAFDGVFEFGVVDVFDCFGGEIDGNAAYV